MVTLQALLLFLFCQLLLYGVPLALLVQAIRIRKRERWAARLLACSAVAPFAYYAYWYVTERHLAPLIRDVQVALWPRKPVTKDNLPRLFVARTDWWVAKTLVGAGPFEKAYSWTEDGWYVYERSGNPACPSRDEWQPYRSRRDVATSTPCVIAAKTDEPDLREPYLRLLSERDAPSRHRPSEGVVSGSTLELRWSENAGGELVAFWEVPYFRAVTFPPVSLGFRFARASYYSPRQYRQRPDSRTFVVEAIASAR